MKTHIYMIRHAESPYVFGEERSRGLSDEGLEAAKKIADILHDEEIHCVISSPYARAIQTVQFLAERKDLPIFEYEDLRERPIKSLEYEAPWEELLKAIETSFTDYDYALEGGESARQVQQRAIPIINELLRAYEGKNIAIGTHGNIMTIIMSYFDQAFGFEFWNSTTKPDIYKMTFANGQYQKTERMWKSVNGNT